MWTLVETSWKTLVSSILALLIAWIVLMVWRIKSRDASLLGLKVVYSPPARQHEPTDMMLNIIAVHGLGSNPATTWSARSDGTRIHWLKDDGFLPNIFPDVTIMTYNHNADFLYQAAPTTAQRSGEQLLEKIARWRAKSKGNVAPFILIGHSYGGLVVKEAVDAAHGSLNQYKDLRKSIVGLIFLGTPHYGSAKSTVGSRLAWLLSFLLGADGGLIRSMELHHPSLIHAHQRFVNNCQAYSPKFDLWKQSKCFYEQKPTMLMQGLINSGPTVNELSASGGHSNPIPLNKDHSGMNKFAQKDDEDFLSICSAIQDLRTSATARNYYTDTWVKRIIRSIWLTTFSVGTKPHLNETLLDKALPISHFDEAQFDKSQLDKPVTVALFRSSIYERWTNFGGHSKTSTHSFLRLRLTRDALYVPLVECVLHQLNQRLSAFHHDKAPFGICFHSISRSGSESASRASGILENIAAQMILKDYVDLTAVDEETRKCAHHVFSSDANNTLQDQYWVLLSRLLNQRKEKARPILIAIDRLDLAHEEDRTKFFLRLKETRSQNPDVAILVSNRPSDAVDRAFKGLCTFDAARDMQDAFNALRCEAQNKHQGDVGKDRLRNTGTWFKDQPQYTELMDAETSSILWLHGAAGSGKSTLTKATLDNLRSNHCAPSLTQMLESEPQDMYIDPEAIFANEQPAARKILVTSYFYHYDMGDFSEMSHKKMLTSILFQIFWQYPDLLALWLQHNQGGINVGSWNLRDLTSIFENIPSWTKHGLAIYIFLDAINESQPDASGVSNSDIVKLLCRLGRSSEGHVTWKIMTASRNLQLPSVDVKPIQINDHNRGDVESVIRAKMAEIRASLRSNTFDADHYEGALNTFERKLRNHHSGVILWVKGVADLVNARVLECTFTLGDLAKFLLDPPPNLEQLYEAIVEQLKVRKTIGDNVAESNTWLRWGVLTSSDLCIAEFKDAVAISGFDSSGPTTVEQLQKLRIANSEPQALQTALALRGGGFIELKQNSHDTLDATIGAMRYPDYKVQVVHESVKVFLTKPTASPFQIQTATGHFFLARMCIRYLVLMTSCHNGSDKHVPDADDVVKHLEKLPLLPYVLESLPSHLDLLEEGHRAGPIMLDLQMLTAGLEARSSHTACILLVWADCQMHESIHTKIWQQFMDDIKRKLPTVVRDYQQVTENILRRAASIGVPNALKSLFAAGVIRHPTANSQLWQEVLTYASHSIKADWQVRAVVARYINQSLVSHKKAGSSASSGAGWKGKTHETGNDRTLLEAVRLALPLEIVSGLIRSSQSLHVRDDFGLTPLHVAAANGYTRLAQLLLESGADVDARDSFERTPLMHAVLNKQVHVSQLLLERGAQIDAADPDGSTAMSIAKEQDQEGIVQLLAYYGADPEPSGVFLTLRPKGWMTVPLEQNPYFVNRPKLMEQIEESARAGDTVVLTGLGGTGKTQLAIEYAKRRHEAHPLESIFWIDGSSLTHIKASCEYLTRVVHADGFNERDLPQDIIAFFLGWLSAQHEGKWTLIIDNVEEEHLFSRIKKHLSTQTGLVLATSRTARILGTAKGVLIKVTVFSQADASRLIKKYLGTKADDPLAVKLVDSLGCHPLAIVQAAAYITSTDLSLRHYLDLLESHPNTAGQLLDQEFEERRGPLQLPNALTQTWAITFNQIQEKNPLSAESLALLSVLHSENCPRSLLSACYPNVDVEPALQILFDFHLVEGSSSHISMHMLVRMATRVWLSTQGRLKTFQLRALRLVHLAFPDRPSFRTRNNCRELLPQANTVLQYEFDDPNDSLLQAALFCAIAMCQLDLKRCDDAEVSFGAAQEIAGQLPPDRSQRVSLSARSGLASVYLQQGRLDEAVSSELKVLETRMEEFAELDSDTISSMVNLAVIHRSMGNLKDAETWYYKALSLQEQLFSDDDDQILTTRAGLAATLVSAGRLSEGLRLQQMVADLRETVLGKSHPETLAAMNNLAITHGMLGDFDKAEKMHMSVLTARATSLEQEDLSIWTSTANLAQIYRAQGKWDEAERLDRDVLKIMQRTLGKEHPSTLAIMANLAATLRTKGVIMHNKGRGIVIRDKNAIAEAKALASSIVQTQERTLGAEHPDTLTSQELRASVLWYDDREVEAEKIIEEVISNRRRVLGEDHPNTLSSMAVYASILALGDGNRLTEAQRLEETVLRGRRKILGPDHPETLSAEENLAATRMAQNPAQEEDTVCVAVHGVEAAQHFATCMDFLGTLNYDEPESDEVMHAALSLCLLRLRLARWSTMVYFGDGVALDESRHCKDVYIADSREENALVNVLKEMNSVFQFIEKSFRSGEANQVEHHQGLDRSLPRMVREINRLTEQKVALRRVWPQMGQTAKKPLRYIFRKRVLLRRFVNDMNDYTESLMELFPQMRDIEKKQAAVDAHALIDWAKLESGLSQAEVQDLFTVVEKAAEEVDPAFLLGMGQGRFIFGGHRYEKNRLSGRSRVHYGDYVNEGSVRSQVGHRYDNIHVGGGARVHMGNNYGGNFFFDD
ncbi:hypothetical protein Q7P36_009411 [Cladosporium allicinum]